ncbi:MAG: ABC transporter permease subunit [Spirochaetota bacterium]
MNWYRVHTLVKKDIREVLHMKMVVLPMIVVPILLCIVIPAVLTILGYTQGVAMISGVDMIEKVIPLYPVPEGIEGMEVKILFIFLNYSFLPLFMVIPVMVSSIITANSVVGEKERKTLETLLYTPITNREFIAAKLFGSFLPGYVLTVVGFILYFAVVNGISLYFGETMLVRSPIWIPGIILFAPALSLLGLSVTLMVSIKAKTYMEAQQMSALIVIPLVLLIVLQITGLVIFNPLYVLLAAVVVLLLDYLLISRLAPRFSREGIITQL